MWTVSYPDPARYFSSPSPSVAQTRPKRSRHLTSVSVLCWLNHMPPMACSSKEYVPCEQPAQEMGCSLSKITFPVGGNAEVSLGRYTWDYLHMWYSSASFVLYPFLNWIFPFLSWTKWMWLFFFPLHIIWTSRYKPGSWGLEGIWSIGTGLWWREDLGKDSGEGRSPVCPNAGQLWVYEIGWESSGLWWITSWNRFCWEKYQ